MGAPATLVSPVGVVFVVFIKLLSVFWPFSWKKKWIPVPFCQHARKGRKVQQRNHKRNLKTCNICFPWQSTFWDNGPNFDCGRCGFLKLYSTDSSCTSCQTKRRLKVTTISFVSPDMEQQLWLRLFAFFFRRNSMGEWTYGLFGCFSNCGICIITYFVPCLTAGQVAEATGKSCVVYAILSMLGCIGVYFMAKVRQDLREANSIEVSCFLRHSGMLCRGINYSGVLFPGKGTSSFWALFLALEPSTSKPKPWCVCPKHEDVWKRRNKK